MSWIHYVLGMPEPKPPTCTTCRWSDGGDCVHSEAPSKYEPARGTTRHFPFELSRADSGFCGYEARYFEARPSPPPPPKPKKVKEKPEWGGPYDHTGS